MCVSKTVEILSFCHFLCQKESIVFQRFWSKDIYPAKCVLVHFLNNSEPKYRPILPMCKVEIE